MGLERFDSEHADISPETTVQQLVDMYGEECVRRGLKYITNLAEADKSFRESADPNDMREGYSRGITGGEVDPDEIEGDAPVTWAERMEENGLGIDDSS